MRVIWKLFLATIKTFYRDRMTFFFTLIFPFMFVIIFGFVFGIGSVGGDNKLLVGVLSSDKRLLEVIKNIDNLEIKEFDSIENIRRAIINGGIDLTCNHFLKEELLSG